MFLYLLNQCDWFMGCCSRLVTHRHVEKRFPSPPPPTSLLIITSLSLHPSLPRFEGRKSAPLQRAAAAAEAADRGWTDSLYGERERERVLHLCTVSFLISFSVADLSSSSVFTAPVMDPRTVVFISNLLLLTAGECPFSLEGTRQIHRLVRWPHRGLILSCDDGMSDCLLVQTDVCSPQVAFASSSGWV